MVNLSLDLWLLFVFIKILGMKVLYFGFEMYSILGIFQEGKME